MQKMQFDGEKATLNSADVMRLADISRRTLERWVSTGKLPALRIPASGERRYHVADVERLITPVSSSVERAS